MNRRRSTVAYNPHLLGRDDLVAGFIARHPLLEEIVDDLRRGGAQHHLLIGQRGSGKTTLLLRLACAIEDDQRLKRGAIALRFPEEQYNVGRLSDLWLNCLDALVDALEERNDDAGARALEAAGALLESLPEEDRAFETLKLLTGWAKRAKRNLILLVDNFDLILDRLAKDHWALRETLSADNRLVLIGASSCFIQESFAYESPFYDFFHVHELGGLDEVEARTFVLRLAELKETPKVVQTIEQDPGRFKALYMLSGGSPRTLALLHGVLAHEETSRAEDDLERLLDGLTPYYKARFDDLAAQSQLVVDAVALHWHPVTAAECAERLQMEVNLVSAQLNRLVRQGVLAKVQFPGSSRLAFQVSERFFNIWYLMRASRRMRRKLFWLVGFLQTFYGEAEVERRASALLASSEGRAAADGGPARLLAFACAVRDAALRRRLEFRAVEMLLERRVSTSTLGDLLDLHGEDAHLVPVIDRARSLREIKATILGSTMKPPAGVDRAAFAEAAVASPWFREAEKRKLADELAHAGTSHLGSAGELLVQFNGGTELFGADLLAAIGRGEVPSFADVTTAADVDDIVALVPVDARPVLFSCVTTFVAISPRPQRAVIDRLISADLGVLPWCLRLFGRAAGLPFWKVVRPSLVRALRNRSGDSLSMLSAPDNWKGFVDAGEASAAIALLDDSGLVDSLLPVYEALRAASAGGRGPLAGLAPEVREPAEEILAAFHADADDGPAPVRAAARAKRAAKPRRLKTKR